MELVVDYGDVVFPTSAASALERAVREAVGSVEGAIARLELRLTQTETRARSWLCVARILFRDGRALAMEVRGVSPTAAALTAARALAIPLRRTG
jgi:hypothetical protein